MRKNHIRIIALLLISLNLFALDYEWQASINKTTAYKNEPILLKYVCTFHKNAELYAIEFNPMVEREDISIKLLTEETRFEATKKIVTYEFVAFVHKKEKYLFAFETNMKKTTQDSIDNTIIGRDNGKYAEYKTKTIKQKAFEVAIKESKSEIVGNLSFEVNKEKRELKALEPYHLEVKFHGSANLYAIKPLHFEIEGVKVFSQEPVIKAELTTNGYRGSWSQKFAFVAEKNFTIPAFSMEYFNLASNKVQRFQQDAIAVEVLPGYKKEDLLDKEEVPLVFDYAYLYYLLTFIAGYLVAKIKFTRNEKSQKSETLFCQKVLRVKSLDELAMLLVLEDSHKYNEILLGIEKKEYNSLSQVKKLICS